MTEDQKRLNVEKEQAQVQEALMPLIAKGEVILEIPDEVRFITFQQTFKKIQPHLLFLSGHGKFHDNSLYNKPSYASFLFEHQLALKGIPHVIGMRESILEPAGTQFNCSFCDAIVKHEQIDT